MRPIYSLFVVLCLGTTGLCAAAETKEPVTSLTPVSTILRPDGSLDLSSGFSGSLDVKGYRMVTGTGGVPRFVRAAASSDASAQAVAASTVQAPENDTADVAWDDQFALPGTDWLVSATAIDGTGNLYIGGSCTAVGNVLANYIAKWDGTSWSALGTGMGGRIDSGTWTSVGCLAVSGSYVYAGGAFTDAGGVNAKCVARWNGTSWSPLGSGLNGAVYDLGVSGSDIYAGGAFTTAGGASANHVAKWDGTSWSALGSGLNGRVYSLAVSGSDIYAGGTFTTAGSGSATNIAKWNGTSWSALGSGLNNAVYALAVSGSDVYAGGVFTTAGGVSANRIAKWDGTSWSTPGTGMNYGVSALAVSGSDVYAGGDFTTAGGASANRIAKWDGTSWSPLGAGMDSGVGALAISGKDVYAAGVFASAGGVGANCIAKWNGTSWSAPGSGSGLNNYAHALAVSGSDVYAGGDFTAAGGVSANRIAKWDGTSWSALGGGMTYSVLALAVDGSDVYAGGRFTTAGGASANYIAKWNGTSWSPLGNVIYSAGEGSGVFALAVSGSDVYAGGLFTTTGSVGANNIARWNGTSWSALGSGIYGASPGSCVFALAVSGSDVYAGGVFTTAGGVSANNIAKWNGTSWSALSSGVSGDPWGYNAVYALAVSGGDVYAGGAFPSAGGVSANNIAKWDGTSWSALGSGMDGGVSALAVSGSDVYAGGSFTTAGGVSANRLAVWNGTSWSALGNGMDGGVRALAVSGNTLLAGGDFSVAGGKVSGFFAELQPRVEVTTVTVSANPGALTIGDSPYGLNRPALITGAGTTVSYSGGLPTTVTLDRADEIRVNGERVNGAFTLSPEGMQFGGAGAAIRVEFSEDDVTLFGGSYTDFRAVTLTYPSGYPSSKEAAGKMLLTGQSAPAPIRIDNGKQIYAIIAPITETTSTYGAVPMTTARVTDWSRY